MTSVTLPIVGRTPSYQTSIKKMFDRLAYYRPVLQKLFSIESSSSQVAVACVKLIKNPNQDNMYRYICVCVVYVCTYVFVVCVSIYVLVCVHACVWCVLKYSHTVSGVVYFLYNIAFLLSVDLYPSSAWKNLQAYFKNYHIFFFFIFPVEGTLHLFGAGASPAMHSCSQPATLKTERILLDLSSEPFSCWLDFTVKLLPIDCSWSLYYLCSITTENTHRHTRTHIHTCVFVFVPGQYQLGIVPIFI